MILMENFFTNESKPKKDMPIDATDLIEEVINMKLEIQFLRLAGPLPDNYYDRKGRHVSVEFRDKPRGDRQIAIMKMKCLSDISMLPLKPDITYYFVYQILSGPKQHTLIILLNRNKEFFTYKRNPTKEEKKAFPSIYRKLKFRN